MSFRITGLWFPDLSKGIKNHPVFQEIHPIDIQNDLCDTGTIAGENPCPPSAILIEEEVVPKMDRSMKQSAVASLLALR
jgi:hypothetical protein